MSFQDELCRDDIHCFITLTFRLLTQGKGSFFSISLKMKKLLFSHRSFLSLKQFPSISVRQLFIRKDADAWDLESRLGPLMFNSRKSKLEKKSAPTCTWFCLKDLSA